MCTIGDTCDVSTGSVKQSEVIDCERLLTAIKKTQIRLYVDTIPMGMIVHRQQGHSFFDSILSCIDDY